MTMPEKFSSESPKLLTMEEVAATLKVPIGTLRKWRSEGTGPQGFRVGKYVRYRRTSVEDFINEQESRA
jgi:predicted DNA-binding transcriptional regulator AlpA